MTEQWKLEGNCKECRRQKHCNKKCTAWKKRQDKIIREVASSLFTVTVDGKYGKIR